MSDSTDPKGDLDLLALADAIRTLPQEMQIEALDVLKRSAELIAAYAQILCHVDSGQLRDSIHVEQTDNLTVKVVAGGPAAPHAPFVEAKYPFLAPAVDMVTPQIAEQLRQLVQVKIADATNK